MLRALATGLLALIVVVSAKAGEFSDINNRFKLTAPEGWGTETAPDPMIAVSLASPRKAETGGNCNVIVTANHLTGQTQAQIDQALSAEITEQFWKETLGQVKFFKSTKIDNWGTRDQGGHKVFFVQATSDVEVGGNSLSVTQVQNLHTLPGQTFLVTCTARAAFFTTESNDFDTILASFEPRSDMTVAAMRWPINMNYLHAATTRMGTDAATYGAGRVARQ